MSTLKKLLILFLYAFTCLNFSKVRSFNDQYTEEENRGLVFPVFTVLQVSQIMVKFSFCFKIKLQVLFSMKFLVANLFGINPATVPVQKNKKNFS